MCVNGWELPAEHVSSISDLRTINLGVLRIQVQAAGIVWGLGTSGRIDWASEVSFSSDPYCAYLYPASRLQPWSAWKEKQYGEPLLHMHIWVLSVIMQVPVKTPFPLCADVCGHFLCCACVCLCVCMFPYVVPYVVFQWKMQVVFHWWLWAYKMILNPLIRWSFAELDACKGDVEKRGEITCCSVAHTQFYIM